MNRLLVATRAHAAFVLRPWGEQALANVLRVAELARTYEAGGGISFRGFVEQLREEAEGEAPEAPIVEESSEGVRMMTVHKAKGLEFPVVVLADITAGDPGEREPLRRSGARAGRDPARWMAAVGRDRSRGRRARPGPRRGRARRVRRRHPRARSPRGAGDRRRSVRARLGRRHRRMDRAGARGDLSGGGAATRAVSADRVSRVRRGQRAAAERQRHARKRQRAPRPPRLRRLRRGVVGPALSAARRDARLRTAPRGPDPGARPRDRRGGPPRVRRVDGDATARAGGRRASEHPRASGHPVGGGASRR